MHHSFLRDIPNVRAHRYHHFTMVEPKLQGLAERFHLPRRLHTSRTIY